LSGPGWASTLPPELTMVISLSGNEEIVPDLAPAFTVALLGGGPHGGAGSRRGAGGRRGAGICHHDQAQQWHARQQGTGEPEGRETATHENCLSLGAAAASKGNLLCHS